MFLTGIFPQTSGSFGVLEGFWDLSTKKRGEHFIARSTYFDIYFVVMRNAMDPGFGRLLTPWSVDFYAYFLTK